MPCASRWPHPLRHYPPWNWETAHLKGLLGYVYQLRALNEENRPLLTDEPVSLRNNRSKFKAPGQLHRCRGMYGIYLQKTGRSQNVSRWTWKHWDLDRLCPKIFTHTRSECQVCINVSHCQDNPINYVLTASGISRGSMVLLLVTCAICRLSTEKRSLILLQADDSSNGALGR